MQHLDEGTVHAWLDGALAGDEAAHVSAHVSECRDCAAMVAEARGVIAAAANIVSALDGVRGGVIPAPTRAVAGQHSLWRRLRFTPARAALAATLLIAVGSLLTIRRAPPPVATDSSVRPAPVAPVAAEAPARAADAATTAPKQPAHRKVQDLAAVPSSPTNMPTPAAGSGTRAMKVPVNALSQAQPPRPSVDSVANAVADQAFARGAAPAARAQSAMQLREVTGATSLAAKSSAFSTGLDGCYQLRSDSASLAVSAGFPSRFALVSASDGSSYVVRSVSPDGRIDSIVPGSSWRRLTPEVVRVSFTNAAEQRSLTFQLAAGVVAGRASVVNREATLPVTRIECRR